MQGYHIVSILIVITTLLTFINSRYIRWPSSIAVTVFSLIISVVVILLENWLPNLNKVITTTLGKIEFNEIVMHVLLGFLLFGAAFKTNAKKFVKHLAPIVSMAFFSTIISTFVMGSLVYYAFDLLHQKLPYIECLLFGALISPTDPIATLAVLRNIGVTGKIELQISGESIINDGIAIVIFTTLTGIAVSDAEMESVGNIAILFLQEAGGGILFGAALGGLAYLMLKFSSNYRVEILITLCVVMGGYALGELLHVSSPIAMVVAGLICSVPDKNEKKTTHISEDMVFYFWELIEEFINVVLFLLIGIGVFVIPFDANIIFIGAICIVILLITRFISIFPVVKLLSKSFIPKSIYVLTWGALRGAVSIALALAIPASLHRAEFLSITYIIAVFTITVQGLTIKPLAKKLGISEREL